MAKTSDANNTTSPPVPAKLPKRARGRPPKISTDAVIEKTMELLLHHSPDEISMAAVADSLRIPVMSLYNYFPNNTALMNAVAEHTFKLFRFPRVSKQSPWQKRLLAWLRAVARHCDRYPVAFKTFSIEGQISTSWNKIMVPVLTMLREMELDDATAALAISWLTSQAIGLIYIEEFAHPARQVKRESDLDLNEEDKQYQHRIERALPKVKREQVLELGFQAIILTLEQMLASATRPGASNTSSPVADKASAKRRPAGDSQKK